jgi:hypothetical protein
MDLFRSGTLFWKASSCWENSSTGDAAPAESPAASAARAAPAEAISVKANTAVVRKHARLA